MCLLQKLSLSFEPLPFCTSPRVLFFVLLSPPLTEMPSNATSQKKNNSCHNRVLELDMIFSLVLSYDFLGDLS